MRFVPVSRIALVLSITTFSASFLCLAVNVASASPMRASGTCVQHFTVRQFSTYTKQVYRRETVGPLARGHMRLMRSCARHPHGVFVMDQIKAREGRSRRARSAFDGTATASWYNDAGQTACGVHYQYGIAHKSLPCGSKVRLCHNGCVTATVQDRGPFIAGRTFDLNAALKYVIGCGDLCSVRYRIGG